MRKLKRYHNLRILLIVGLFFVRPYFLHAENTGPKDRLEEAVSVIESASLSQKDGKVLVALDKYCRALESLYAVKKEFPDSERAELFIFLAKSKIKECREMISAAVSKVDEKISALSDTSIETNIPEVKNIPTPSAPAPVLPKEENTIEVKKDLFIGATPTMGERIRAGLQNISGKLKEAARVYAKFIMGKAEEVRQNIETVFAKRPESPKQPILVTKPVRPMIVEEKPRPIVVEEKPAPVIEEKPAPMIAEEKPAPVSYNDKSLESVKESFQEPQKIPEPAKWNALVGVAEAAEEVPQIPTGQGWVVTKKAQDTGYDFTGYETRKDITFSFEGESFKIDQVSLVKGNEIWIPLEFLTSKMNIMFLRISEKRFGIIRDDGLPLEFEIGNNKIELNKEPYLVIKTPPALFDNNVMLSLDSVSVLLQAVCVFDSAANAVSISRKKTEGEEAEGELETFTLTKPPEPEKKERTDVIPLDKSMPTDIREEILPAQYEKDVDLHLDASGMYFEDKASHDRTRQMQLNLSGRVKDYFMSGYYKMKDFRTSNKQRFKQDGEFFHVYDKDISFKFFDNSFNIPTLRSQSQAYFGTEIAYTYEQFKTTAILGQTDNTFAGSGNIGSVRYLGDLLILKSGYTAPSKVFETNETFIYWQNNVVNDNQAGSTIFPRRNIAFITENAWRPRDGLKVSGSYGLSNYEPDNKLNASFMDSDWKLGIDYAQRRYSFSTYYERVGQQYASIGIPSSYQDNNTFNFGSGFRFTDNWNASVNAQLSKNNIEGDPRRQTNFNKNLSISTGLTLPWQQSVSIGYSVNESIMNGGDRDRSGNRYQDYRIDYSKQWGNMNAQLSYDHYELDGFSAGTGATVTDMASLNVFNSYPELNDSFIRFYQNYRRVKNFADNTYTTEYGDTSVGGRLNITKYLSVNTDWKVSYQLAEAFTDTADSTFTTGVQFQSSPVTTFNFDFSLLSYDLYDEKTWIPKHYTLMFRGRHVFDFFTSDKWGRVKVLIYKDLNGSGTYDPGEPGIKEVRVYPVNGRAKFTNDKGEAFLDKVVPGDRDIKVDLSTLPLDYVTRGPSIKTVKVEPEKTAKIDFPVVRTGDIVGRVYVDNDDNGQYDGRIDMPVPNARIYLDPQMKDTLSLSDGSYYLDYVYPGDYNVCIDIESIPTGTTIKNAEKVQVVLKENDKIKDIDFILSPRAMEVESFASE